MFNLNFIEIYYNLAKETYHVDPLVFTVLMFASGPPYYWTWYSLLREIVLFAKRCKRSTAKIGVLELFNDKKFLLLLFVNRSAWIMPYLYVIFWGDNLPGWFWAALIGWIFLGSYAFWRRLNRIVYNKG